MNKQIEVQIMGQSYLLGCPDDGEGPLREAVERVDAAMCKIRDAGKVKARDRIAVLASLNLAFDLARREAQPAAAAPASEPSTAQNTAHNHRAKHWTKYRGPHLARYGGRRLGLPYHRSAHRATDPAARSGSRGRWPFAVTRA